MDSIWELFHGRGVKEVTIFSREMEDMKLSRYWARIIIALLGFSGTFAFVSILGDEIYYPILAIIFLLAGLSILSWKHSCPNCGKDKAPPQWESNKKRYCRMCGQLFEYDR